MTEAEENKMVEDAFQRLLDTYLDSPHRKKVDIITTAFNFARQAHKGVRRLSGEPYIMHPLAVAQIASQEMGLGSTSICSALLHDVVEDTEYTTEDLQNIFGPKIAEIVDGLTKISGGIFGDHASPQTENLKKLLLTMSSDIRVILIKICDRLHNMRTLESQPKNKRYKIAGETLYIYAPLAYRLGLNQIKSELENLSFKYEHPETYDSIVRQLKLTQEDRDTLFHEITDPIRQLLDRQHITYQLKARVKTPYSIWQKMQNKNIPFEEIYDILAIRIIITPKNPQNESEECFNIYSLLNRIYTTQNERLRDWINHPKANGYQALHTTIMTPKGWIEVQIRTDRMDQIAERGIAAHWRYKLQQPDLSDEGELGNWLTTIQEILNDPQPDALDFLDTIKLNLFAKEILVYTPKGEFKTLPAGSTALDFAYYIHSFLGTHAIGAKVNHKLVPISHKLASGDQVEILTSPTRHPEPEWLSFAQTAKAQTKIKASLRRRERETRKAGQDQLNQWLADNSLQPTTLVLQNLMRQLHQPTTDSLYLAIGAGTANLKKVKPATLNAKPEKPRRKRQRKRQRPPPDLAPIHHHRHRRQLRPVPAPQLLPSHPRRRHPRLHRPAEPHTDTPARLPRGRQAQDRIRQAHPPRTVGHPQPALHRHHQPRRHRPQRNPPRRVRDTLPATQHRHPKHQHQHPARHLPRHHTDAHPQPRRSPAHRHQPQENRRRERHRHHHIKGEKVKS